MIRDFWILRRYYRRRWAERLTLALVWRLPRWLVYWCAIRLGADATTGRYGSTVVPDLRFMDALQRWERRDGGDRSSKARAAHE